MRVSYWGRGRGVLDFHVAIAKFLTRHRHGTFPI